MVSVIVGLVVALASQGTSTQAANAEPVPSKPHIFLFTFDDLDKDDVGVFGGRISGATPHLDRLARQGLRFEHAHAASPVCQPARQSMLTGLHPHRNGSFGFEPIAPGTPTLPALLKAAGYFVAILGKGAHHQPTAAFAWDYAEPWLERYNTSTADFVRHLGLVIDRARAAGKPLFVSINTTDPHRPFIGSAQMEEVCRDLLNHNRTPVTRHRLPDARTDFAVELTAELIPGYLPDLPDIRLERAQYFATLQRGDRTLGAVLDLLRARSLEENSLFVACADQGAAFPRSKYCLYRQSTATPLIVRWLGRIAPDRRDDRSVVSTMDLMPTLLEVAGVARPERLDGRSLVPLFAPAANSGGTARDYVFTTLNHHRRGVLVYPSRAIVGRDFVYVFNAWSDGQTRFHSESHSGLSFAALKKSAAGSPAPDRWYWPVGFEARQEALSGNAAIAAFVRDIEYRAREELFDLARDTYCLNNLASSAAHAATLAALRDRLRQEMTATDDPLLPAFEGRGPIPVEWFSKRDSR